MIFLIFKFYWASGILSGNPKWNPNYAGSLTPALSGEGPAWQVLSLGALLAPTVRLPGLPSMRVGLLQLPETSFSRSSWGECNHCFLSLTGQFTWRVHLWDAGNQSTSTSGRRTSLLLGRFMVCSIPEGGRSWTRKSPGFCLRESLVTCEVASDKPGLNEQTLFHG